MTSITACASCITANIARVAIVQAIKENYLQPEDLHWRMHPAQLCMVTNLYEAVALESLSEVKSLEDIDAVRHLAKDYFPVTFLGRPITQDAKMHPSHIDVLDANDKLLCRIKSLALPIGFEIPHE